MRLAVCLALILWSICEGRPQQGYGYQQPQAPPPANLYETPTSAPPSPPRPPVRPSNNYGSPSNPGPVQVGPPPPSPPRRPAPESPAMEGMPYDFDWGVDDPDSGNTFSHVETSDGQRTEGEYRVLLPDGRMQIVKFYDDGNGFNADVSYT